MATLNLGSYTSSPIKLNADSVLAYKDGNVAVYSSVGGAASVPAGWSIAGGAADFSGASVLGGTVKVTTGSNNTAAGLNLTGISDTNFTWDVTDTSELLTTVVTGTYNDSVKLAKSTNVNLGDGNNVVSVAAAAGDITGGAGGDSIVVVDTSDDLRIESGAGEDSVLVTAAQKSLTIDAGDGKDSVTVGTAASDVTVNLGADANYVSVLSAGGDLTISAESGNDSVVVTGFEKTANISLGDGNNEVSIVGAGKELNLTLDSGNDSVFATATGGTAEINLGAGNNTAAISVTGDSAVISAGDGKDSVNLVGSKDATVSVSLDDGADSLIASVLGGTVAMGSGKNVVSIMGALDGLTVTGETDDQTIEIKAEAGAAINVTTGAGKDLVSLVAASANDAVGGTVNVGAGKDSVTVAGNYTGTLTAGEGNKSVSISGTFSEGSLTFGSGSDTLTITGRASSDTITMGDGKDSVVFAGGFTESTLDLGAGDDSLVASVISGSTINLGDGKDFVSVAGDIDGASIAGGEGADVFDFTSAAAGGTAVITDFTPDTDVVVTGKAVTNAAFKSDGTISVGGGAYVQMGTGTNGYYYATAAQSVGGAEQTYVWTGESSAMVDLASYNHSMVMIGTTNTADDGADTLIGGTKNDTIYAGAGDMVYGGTGKDSVVFTAGDKERETIAISSAGGKVSVTGFSAGTEDENDKIWITDKTLSDVSSIKIDSGNTILKLGTSTLTVENVTTGTFKVQDSTNSDYTVALIGNGATKSVSDVDAIPNVFYLADNASDAKLDFSGISDNLVIDLGNTGAIEDNTTFKGAFTSVKGGKETTVLMGAGNVSESLVAGGGNTSLWGGGAKADTLVGTTVSGATTTFWYGNGDGKDVISNGQWGNNDESDVLYLYGGATVSKFVREGSSTDVVVKLAADSDKLTIKNLGTDTVLKYTTDGSTIKRAKIGSTTTANTFTYSSDVDSYFGSTKGDTLKLDSSSGDATIVLDDANFGSIKTVDATSNKNGDTVIIAGNGAVNESIRAGKGDTSIWGGTGSSNDTLASSSSAGSTTFWFGLGDGNDVITTTYGDDKVYLYNVICTTSKNQISAFEDGDSGMILTLEDGSSLTIAKNNYGTSSKVSTFVVKDETGKDVSYTYNHSTKSWS